MPQLTEGRLAATSRHRGLGSLISLYAVGPAGLA